LKVWKLKNDHSSDNGWWQWL
jgi:mannose-1-phosphate guanylyltransferase